MHYKYGLTTIQIFFLINDLDLSCKLYSYITSVTTLFSSWLNVLCSIDVYLTVNYSSRFQFRKQLKYQLLAIFIVLVSSSLVSLPFLLYSIVKAEIGCSTYSYQISFYLNLYFTVIFLIIPFILMVSANTSVFLRLKEHKKHTTNHRKYKTAKYLFKISLGMNLLFLVSNLPVYIVYIVGNLLNTFFSPFFL